MFIQTEQTPNPQTLKFLPGKVVMKEGTAFYENIDEAVDSPFAKRLFAVDLPVVCEANKTHLMDKLLSPATFIVLLKGFIVCFIEMDLLIEIK